TWPPGCSKVNNNDPRQPRRPGAKPRNANTAVPRTATTVVHSRSGASRDRPVAVGSRLAPLPPKLVSLSITGRGGIAACAAPTPTGLASTALTGLLPPECPAAASVGLPPQEGRHVQHLVLVVAVGQLVAHRATPRLLTHPRRLLV